MWKRKAHRQLLLLDRGDVEIGGRRDAAFGQFHQVVDRRHRAAAEDLAGEELGRPDRGGEFLEQRRAVRPEAEQEVGHEHRHQPGQRRRGNPGSSARGRGRAATAGRADSTSVAPSLSPSTDLISAAAAVQIATVAFSPGRTSIDSRMMPMRMPLSAPGAPEARACSA